VKKVFGLLVLTWTALALGQDQKAPQSWSGVLSDSMCGASHRTRAAAANMSDRECIFECIKSLARYVLVDDKGQIIPIATQDLGGLPLYAGRPVRLTGELRDGAIFATKVEAIPAHLHLGHVMTNWRDTPSNVGFLIAAISDAKIASTHAELAAGSSGNLDDMKLHAGHVLNALDPTLEPKGPGSGYGVSKAVNGALQHLELAAGAEGSTPNIRTHAAAVAEALKSVLQRIDQANAAAQKIRAAKSAAEASPSADELSRLTRQISENGLPQAKNEMDLIMKGEGLENAPR
jgi:hypothetical protein